MKGQIIKSFIHDVSQKTAKLDNALNFSIPGFYSIGFNNSKAKKGLSIKSLEVSRQNPLYTYMGKLPDPEMPIAKEKMYSENFIRMILYKLFYETTGDVHIILGTSVTQICNGPEGMKGHLTLPDAIEYILTIARQYYPREASRLHITPIEDLPYNKEFFKKLHNLNDIKPSNNLPENPETITSLSLFCYLLDLYQKDDSFKKSINKITPQEVVTPTGHYYSLIEIACRITDFFHGVHIQAGAEKQSDYDDIITHLLNPQSPLYPGAAKLKKLSEQYGDKDFVKVYFDHHNSKEFIQDLSQKEKKEETALQGVYKKLKKIGIGAALFGVLATGFWEGGMWYAGKQKEEQRKKDRIENAIPYIAADKRSEGYSTYNPIAAANYGELLWNRFEEYDKRDIMGLYDISTERCQELKETYLTWCAKQNANGRYAQGNQYSEGEPKAHKIHDFVFEQGSTFGLKPSNYMPYMKSQTIAMQNTLTAPKSLDDINISPDDVKILSKNPLNPYITDGFGSTAEAGTTTIDGKKYIVGRGYPWNEGNKLEPFTIRGGKNIIHTYYMNTPGAYAVARRSYEIQHPTNLTGSNFTGYDKYWAGHETDSIQNQIVALLEDGYTFDFYTINLQSDIGFRYFYNTFIASPKVADSYYNLNPFLDQCMQYIENNKMFKGQSQQWTTAKKNAIKSIIFNAAYQNGYNYANGSTHESVKILLNDLSNELAIPLHGKATDSTRRVDGIGLNGHRSKKPKTE